VDNATLNVEQPSRYTFIRRKVGGRRLGQGVLEQGGVIGHSFLRPEVCVVAIIVNVVGDT
jgi:hypothetical protein